MTAAPVRGSAQLSDYTTLLRRQAWVVILAVTLGIALALAYTSVAPRQYSSSTSVLVTDTGVAPSGDSSSRAGTINLDTEAQLMTSTEIVRAAAATLGWTGELGDLSARLGISVPPNTEILDLTFHGPTAEDAQAGAAAFAGAYLEDRRAAAEATVESDRASIQAQVDDLNGRLQAVTDTLATLPDGSAAQAYNQAQASSLNSQLSSLGARANQLDAITVTPGRVITQASLPAAPSSPDLRLNLVAGVLVGLLLGVALAVLRQRSDPYVRRSDDVDRQVGVPVLGDLPKTDTPERVELATAWSAEGRTYARLRNAVAAGMAERSRVLPVAGVSGAAGPVAANLAAALGRAGEDVVLVCGDVHASTATQLLDAPDGAGLSEVLAGAEQLDAALHSLPDVPTVRVLGPGTNRDQAAALLQTAGFKTLVDALLERPGRIVIEAPPTTSGADAQTLAGSADAAILVVETNRTRAQHVIDARGQLASMRTPVLGAVVVATPRARKERAGAVAVPPGRRPGAGKDRVVPPGPLRAAGCGRRHVTSRRPAGRQPAAAHRRRLMSRPLSSPPAAPLLSADEPQTPVKPRLLPLPAGWPLTALLVLYPLWWALGMGTLIVFILAVPMLLHLVNHRPVATPPGFGIWVLFLLWVLASTTMLGENPPGVLPDTASGRVISVAFNLAGYLSATVILLYAGNLSESEFPRRRLTRQLGGLFIVVVLGGLLGTFAPHVSFTSPVELLLPHSVASNGFVQSLVHPSSAQVQEVLGYESPRPSAPFGYTNTWGNCLALLLGWFVVSWFSERDTGRRAVGVVVLGLAAVPIIYSLNRGLWAGLGLIVVVTAVRYAVRGRAAVLIGLVAAVVLAAVVVLASPLSGIVQGRFDNPKSNDIRAFTTVRTLEVVDHSPVLGFGSTRAALGSSNSIAIGASDKCPRCGNPTLGSNGQIWLVLVAQGYVGAALFVGFFLRSLWAYRRNRTPIGDAGLLACALPLFFMFVYNSLTMPLVVAFLSIAALWRGQCASRATGEAPLPSSLERLA
ncbi:Chromosome partitioning ATPase, Mrp family, contains Fe-S cluster [Modestobacter sp. DSM 44400]|uniref:Wzz/FepE/Etk N-terminal domain-containing protein n=1 Tax=Modestobacter sp. DSM 44400 TaxID=1550230 RepID=UPI00089B01DF|nr:Wzz/FepE/Etk N-terminal domain-containing protein [Modestobacter sp. DSM 44400]SDX86544.1 Chromosome partitioning ATPase, Mrp family, contains Fe-S cluster [Modestobacter sp. DSM 44400]